MTNLLLIAILVVFPSYALAKAAVDQEEWCAISQDRSLSVNDSNPIRRKKNKALRTAYFQDLPGKTFQNWLVIINDIRDGIDMYNISIYPCPSGPQGYFLIYIPKTPHNTVLVEEFSEGDWLVVSGDITSDGNFPSYNINSVKTHCIGNPSTICKTVKGLTFK